MPSAILGQLPAEVAGGGPGGGIVLQIQRLAHLGLFVVFSIGLLFVGPIGLCGLEALVPPVLTKLHQSVGRHVERPQLVRLQLLQLLAKFVILCEHVRVHPKQLVLDNCLRLRLLALLFFKKEGLVYFEHVVRQFEALWRLVVES